uniref:KRAB domain-containing protein n=1 Tax=Podarcis muralis TaxID=64176 RepID=A0A670KII3_PODMU
MRKGLQGREQVFRDSKQPRRDPSGETLGGGEREGMVSQGCSLSFEDVAVPFPGEEWVLLDPDQRALHQGELWDHESLDCCIGLDGESHLLQVSAMQDIQQKNS